jgi:hypothetical protein
MPLFESKDPLSRVIQGWRVQPVADPQFRPAVWQRIHRQQTGSWAHYVSAHKLGWGMATLVAVAGAMWTGKVAADRTLAAERDAMVVSYLVELDPRVQAGLRP